jgi:hypothetical protein
MVPVYGRGGGGGTRDSCVYRGLEVTEATIPDWSMSPASLPDQVSPGDEYPALSSETRTRPPGDFYPYPAPTTKPEAGRRTYWGSPVWRGDGGGGGPVGYGHGKLQRAQ